MRRALLGTALSAFVIIAFAEPVSAASSGPLAASSTVTSQTDTSVQSDWQTDPVASGAGFKQKSWGVGLTISSSDGSKPVTTLSAGYCTDYYDGGMTFTKEICTTGSVTSGFTYTLDSAGFSHASASAVGMPASTCTYNANFELVGCKSAAPINVHATWTGQGPFYYSKYVDYSPGLYRYVTHIKQREADASAAINGTSPRGQLGHSLFYRSTTTSRTYG